MYPNYLKRNHYHLRVQPVLGREHSKHLLSLLLEHLSCLLLGLIITVFLRLGELGFSKDAKIVLLLLLFYNYIG